MIVNSAYCTFVIMGIHHDVYFACTVCTLYVNFAYILSDEAASVKRNLQFLARLNWFIANRVSALARLSRRSCC